MFGVLQLQNGVMALIHLALLVVTLFAFISSLLYPAEAYRAAGKWTKQGWAILLGVAAFLPLIISLGIIQIALTIAALVYLADVRPALSSLRRR
ncbi:DUF2516 family protein [Nocardioides sp.]|uniref:DUF2516 family protein n=1 Tax=Nocardioides sp. TaxID=35761 RepID=UPI002BC60663|nr:DUF2516 family protein [Nocardioides sp.]HVX53925.1 DUF2516 family protein [Nocardioides sp.]